MKGIVCGIMLTVVGLASSFAMKPETCQAKEKIVFTNVEKGKLTVTKGDSYRIKIDKEYLKGKRKIEWTSSDSKIIKVTKKGTLKAKKVGKAKVTAEISETGKKASIRVVVKKLVKLKKLKIQADKYLFVNETKEIKVTMLPKKNSETLTYKSTNKNIVAVDEDGKILGKAAGTAWIVVRSDKTHKTVKKKIVVRKNEAQTIRFTETNSVVGIAQSKQLEMKINPNWVTNQKINYTSSDPTIATVDQTGKVTGVKTGSVEIRAVLEKNRAITAKCTVIVSKAQGMLTKAMLDKLNLSAVDNLMIVAHPDDETLFGGAHLISDNYLVVCLTNAKISDRAHDFNAAMDISEDKRIMLSYPDTQGYKDGKLIYDDDYKWNYHQLAIQADINLLLNYKKWNTVVTHNPEGEYGHYHHKKVNKYTTDLYRQSPDCTKRFMYFAKYFEKNQLTDSLQNTLPKTNSQLFDIKVKMLDAYKSKHWTCFVWLWHIQPYEKWVYYDDWK